MKYVIWFLLSLPAWAQSKEEWQRRALAAEQQAARHASTERARAVEAAAIARQVKASASKASETAKKSSEGVMYAVADNADATREVAEINRKAAEVAKKASDDAKESNKAMLARLEQAIFALISTVVLGGLAFSGEWLKSMRDRRRQIDDAKAARQEAADHTGRLEHIRVLVNSDKTAQMQDTLTALRSSSVLLEDLHETKRSQGKTISAESEQALVDLRERIKALDAQVKARLLIAPEGE